MALTVITTVNELKEILQDCQNCLNEFSNGTCKLDYKITKQTAGEVIFEFTFFRYNELQKVKSKKFLPADTYEFLKMTMRKYINKYLGIDVFPVSVFE